MSITPIETRYAGHRFRSRLEARWAVFFDQLGIPWEYEPQGYLVDGAPYLPDFLLYANSDQAFWFEVKGQFPTDSELERAQGLATGSELPVYVYFAKPEMPAPDLSHITTMDQFHGPDQWTWVDEDGWQVISAGPASWEYNLKPTAFRLNPPFKGKTRPPKSGFWWWTDCPFCPAVLLKLRGQVGICPIRHQGEGWVDPGLYPRFAHNTARLQKAYWAARSARFEHGERG
ncbi:PDDEXK family nuclease [Streptomonospora nanhaiensis]|uniref:Uncharacterized protein n=1 Tax=Streptomonospora nanhaiensis TaxID=1323731 RepID=A0A853BT11_9ACTN|nr:hypothetical protein [Streptomonospora nanhaiensis]MBV2366201.1 hypothetical protein [Streptomonospora nanhaiensis]NYI98283.1 hypothetical protein [Streptomonospora nanhaiensis]